MNVLEQIVPNWWLEFRGCEGFSKTRYDSLYHQPIDLQSNQNNSGFVASITLSSYVGLSCVFANIVSKHVFMLFTSVSIFSLLSFFVLFRSLLHFNPFIICSIFSLFRQFSLFHLFRVFTFVIGFSFFSSSKHFSSLQYLYSHQIFSPLPLLPIELLSSFIFFSLLSLCRYLFSWFLWYL